MIELLEGSLARHAPLKIDGVDYSDPTVTLAGMVWSLAITCPWQLLRGSTRITSWDDKDAADAVWDLVGHSIVGVHARSSDRPNDPTFVLTEDLSLEIHADTDLDPWVFRLPEMTFVGYLSGQS